MYKTKVCTKCNVAKSIFEFHKSTYTKDGLKSCCKSCRNIQEQERYIKNTNKIKNTVNNYRKLNKLKILLRKIKGRCNNKNHHAYKYYGGKGIKCLITEEELKKLWLRDKAYLMKKPSIDREDNDNNYCYDNCQFLEFEENRLKDKRKIVLQYDSKGNFIKEWISASDAGRGTNICIGTITYACRNTNTSKSNGFVWKYKEGIK